MFSSNDFRSINNLVLLSFLFLCYFKFFLKKKTRKRKREVDKVEKHDKYEGIFRIKNY